LNNRTSITAHARFAKNIWNYCAVAVWNSMNVTFNPTPLPGLRNLSVGYRWFAPPPAMSNDPFGI
jgi:hypothetical protein